MLKKRVGRPISYSSLAEDLQCSDKTVKRWLNLLENMYVVFKLTPFHKNIARSNLKKPKCYFYDIAQVSNGDGTRLENLVACSLLKECHFRQDIRGEHWDPYYLSKKGELELDFLICNDDIPTHAFEVKTFDSSPSKNFSVFSKDLPNTQKVQLVHNLEQEKTFSNGLEIRKIENWLPYW